MIVKCKTQDELIKLKKICNDYEFSFIQNCGNDLFFPYIINIKKKEVYNCQSITVCAGIMSNNPKQYTVDALEQCLAIYDNQNHQDINNLL